MKNISIQFAIYRTNLYNKAKLKWNGIMSKQIDYECVMRRVKKVEESPEAKMFINSFDDCSTIVIDERYETVGINHHFMSQFHHKNRSNCYGRSFGHIINCVAMQQSKVGCGETLFCVKCDMNKLLTESINKSTWVDNVVNLTINGPSNSYRQKFHASSLTFKTDNNSYTAIMLEKFFI